METYFGMHSNDHTRGTDRNCKKINKKLAAVSAVKIFQRKFQGELCFTNG